MATETPDRISEVLAALLPKQLPKSMYNGTFIWDICLQLRKRRATDHSHSRFKVQGSLYISGDGDSATSRLV